MAVYVDPHVQGLHDRVKQLEARRARLELNIEELHTDVGAVDATLARVRARYVAALVHSTASEVDDAKQKGKARRRALNAKIKQPGQYVVVPASTQREHAHIGITSAPDNAGCVNIAFLCPASPQRFHVSREFALTLARETRGELPNALAALRTIRRSRTWRAECETCEEKARTALKPPKAEVE